MDATSNDQQWVRQVETQVDELRQRQESIWPAHIPRDFPQELEGQTFIEIFRRNAQAYAECAAIQFYGTPITYAQLDQWSDSFAGWLQRHEVRPGDRVGLFLPNCPQFIILMLGTLKAGAVHVPINPMFKRSELEYEANDAGISVIVAPNYLMDVVDAAEMASVRHIAPINIQDLVPNEPTIRLPKFLEPGSTTKTTENVWEDLVSGEAIAQVDLDPDALAALNYTGGTTGKPKGCMHTQGNMVVAGHNCAIAWGLVGPESVDNEAVLAFTPIFWISGENNGILAPLFAGATIVLLARWDVTAALQAIEKYRVTAMSGVVESFLELLESSEDSARQLSSLRHLRAMSFSRRLSIDIRRQWEDATGGNSVLRESSFGMTESHTSNTFTTGLEVDDFDLLSEPVFVGLPMPGTDVIITNPATGEPKPFGEVGEIVLRSPSNFKGYWQKTGENAAVLRDGWVFTGDTGKLSADGALHYLGRQKEMLKVNGMSVFPSEVEVLMSRHRDIESVAVVGHPDEKTGQSVHAFVKLNPGSTATAEQLQEWARESMATYKVPRVHLLSELPMTATGKIRKNDLPSPQQLS